MHGKTLAILDCDHLAPELAPEFKNYGVMFSQLLAPLSCGWTIKTYWVVDGHWPELEACDAYLITGSKAGVYEDHLWIERLSEFARQAYGLGIPLIGICFGHQLLAHSLGGYAGKSEKGWGVGLRSVYASSLPAWMEPKLDTLRLLYSHQDQVTALPPEAVSIYGDEFCPLAAYTIDNKVLAFQGHPEFTKPYIEGLMALRKNRYAPGQYEQALASLNESEDGRMVGKWIFDFLDHSMKQRIEVSA